MRRALFWTLCALSGGLCGCDDAAGADDALDAQAAIADGAADAAPPDLDAAPPDLDAAPPADPDAAPPPDPDPDAAPPPPDPDAGPPPDIREPGPHRVGFREATVTYTPPVGDGTTRTLRLALWYPTADESGAEARYFRGLVRRAEVFTDAAPLPAPAGGRPLLLFSHGSNGIAEQSFFMTERFASHGWVVAAPDHTGNTFLDVGQGLPPQLFYLRALDLRAVLDHLDALPADDPLAGQLNDEVVVSGHSFGGYTTLVIAGATFDLDVADAACVSGELDEETCALVGDGPTRALFAAGLGDARVDVAIPQAPAYAPFFAADAMAHIEVPVLLFTGGQDETLPNPAHGDPIWDGLDGPSDIRVDLSDAGHFTFSNACDALPAGAIDGDGCGEGFIDPAAAQEVVNTLSLAFIHRELWGDDEHAALLDGSESLDPSAVISTH